MLRGDAALPKYRELPLAEGGARSGWGVFGADDNIGLVNLQTGPRAVNAAQQVKSGKVFALDLTQGAIDPPLFSRGITRRTTFELRSETIFDDVQDNAYAQSSSQWDSLGHVAFQKNSFYNGARAIDIREGRRNTIEHWGNRGIVGRGILFDMQRTAGETYSPGDSVALTVSDLERARIAAGVEYQVGDILLLHTGYVSWHRQQCEEVRGRHSQRSTLTSVGIEHSEEMCEYLWDSHISAIAADNPTVEVWPPDERSEAWPFGFLHQILIGQFGMALGELWQIGDLAEDCAKDGVYEFLLVSAPQSIAGGIGSAANAIAIK